MYETPTNGTGQPSTDALVRIVKRRRTRKELPELDLRTPSGKRTLPY